MLCDSVLGLLLAACVGNTSVTVAHSTRTKIHHYHYRAAGLGWMAPSNLSLAIHGLKAKPELASGPNATVGGEWEHTHSAVRAATTAGFPPLLWRYDAGWSGASPTSRALLAPLNDDVHEWYNCRCTNSLHEFKAALQHRAERTVRALRGPQPADVTPVKYLGGNPTAWGIYGCSPHRFFSYPRWPPAQRWKLQPEVAYGDRRFEWCDFGPTRDEILAIVRPAFDPAAAETSDGARLAATDLSRRLAAAFLSTGSGVDGRERGRLAALLQTAVARSDAAPTMRLAPRRGGGRDGGGRARGRAGSRGAAPANRSRANALELIVDAARAGLSHAAKLRDLRDGDAGVRALPASKEHGFVWEWV